MAEFLRFTFSHQSLLSNPSDILVCFMTFSRLRIIWNVEKQKIRNHPKPIASQVIFAYIFSILMEAPAFFMYDINNCTNETMEDAILEGPACWSYVETADVTKTPFWEVYAILECILTRIIPALVIICMNIIMVIKLHDIWKKKKASYVLRESSNISQRKSSLNELIVSKISKRISKKGDTKSSNLLAVPDFYPRRDSKHLAKGLYSSLKELRLSILLVSTLLFYTIFTTPKTVFNVLSLVDLDGVTKIANYRLLSAICNVFFTINYSFNFYFYCLTNKDIREAFITLISICKK